MPHSLYYKLTHHWSIDDICNKIGYIASTAAGIVGILIITAIPAPMPEKEAKVREWVKRKDDEDDEPTPGDQIRLFKTGLAKYLNSDEYKSKQKRRAIREKKRRLLLMELEELK